MPKNDQLEKEALNNDSLLMDELILNTPNWLLRSGITLIAIALVLGLSLAWLIEYPDKLEAPFILTSEQPPIDIICRLSAQVESILVWDQKEVCEGQVIIKLNSMAEWQDIQLLSNYLLQIEKSSDVSALNQLPLPTTQFFGELQTSYRDLLQLINQLRIFIDQDLTQKKVNTLRAEIGQLQELNQSLVRQEQVFQDELALTKKDFHRNKLLNQDQLISDKDFELITSQWLQKKRTLEGIYANKIQNEIRQKQLQSQHIELMDNQQEDLHQYYIAIQHKASQLRKELRVWKETYLITSPIAGVLHYPRPLTIGQFVTNSQGVATVIPQSEKGRIKGTAFLSPQGIGNIEVGSKVQIRLEAYPSKEYGIIKSQVDKIAIMPIVDDNGRIQYMIEMGLPDTLKTTYNYIVPFKQQLGGVATIITREKRLLERFFESILNILKNQ